MGGVVQFASDFEDFKRRLKRLPSAYQRLAELTDFWPRVEPVSKIIAYETFLAEYRQFAISNLDSASLSNLILDELLSLHPICQSILAPDHCEIVSDEIVRQLLYVGCIEDAVKWLTPEAHTISAQLTDSINESRDEIDALRRAINELHDSSPNIAHQLNHHLTTWEGHRDRLWFDRVQSLFVEYRNATDAGRGRMHSLLGSAHFDSKLSEDRVVFENQARSADDPLLRSAYTTISAVKSVLDNSTRQKREHVRLEFGLDGARAVFGGESVGLAVALLVYVQLMKDRVERHERFMASDVAVTGVVNEAGNVQPVNQATIAAKIERAFFSSVKYVIVPKQSYEAATLALSRLNANYPRRRLKVIAHDTLADVIDDHNIIRPEKVCLGQYVSRKAIKYSGGAKVQVPILLVLVYLLVCLVYPKASPWFDWNPALIAEGNRKLDIKNKNGDILWTYEVECEIDTVLSYSLIADIDGDHKNEVMFVLKTRQTCEEDINAYLHLFDDDLTLLQKKSCVIFNEYPNDTTLRQPYEPAPIALTKNRGEYVIVTRIHAQYPARAHFKFWSPSGKLLGWYIHSGYGGNMERCFKTVDSTHIAFALYNNRMERAALIVLDPRTASGVSPPYDDTSFDLTWVKRGTQSHYVSMTSSDIRQGVFAAYTEPKRLFIFDNLALRVAVSQSDQMISPPELLFDFDSNFRLKQVLNDDRFFDLRDSLVKAKVLNPIADQQEYLRSIHDSVLYWTDSGWISESDL